MHDVADIDEAETDAAADRRSDAGIGELEFGVVNQALIRCNGAIKLTNQCCLGIELLLRDDAFFKEQLITLKIDLGVLPLRLVFSKLSQSLLKLDLEGTRINLGEEISFVEKLTFLKRDAAELAIDATANRDGVEGGDRAKAIEIDGQIATLGDRKSTRLNSSHLVISYAVFCLKKKKKKYNSLTASENTSSSGQPSVTISLAIS